MALQRVRRQTWKKHQEETSPGVPTPGQGTTHVGTGLSQGCPPSSGIGTLRAQHPTAGGARAPPGHPQGSELLLRHQHHDLRSRGLWALQSAPAQSRASSRWAPSPWPRGVWQGRVLGRLGPAALASPVPRPGDSLAPWRGWEGAGGEEPSPSRAVSPGVPSASPPAPSSRAGDTHRSGA